MKKFIFLVVCIFKSLGAQNTDIHYIQLSDLIDEVGFVIEDCIWCEDGRSDVYSGYCDRCKSWSIEFRRNNTCAGCYNLGKKIGSKKCEHCLKGLKVDRFKTEHKIINHIKKKYRNKGVFIFLRLRDFDPVSDAHSYPSGQIVYDNKRSLKDKNYQKSVMDIYEKRILSSLFGKVVNPSNEESKVRMISCRNLSRHLLFFKDNKVYPSSEHDLGVPLSYNQWTKLFSTLFPRYRFANNEENIEFLNKVNKDKLYYRFKNLLIINRADHMGKGKFPYIRIKSYKKNSNKLELEKTGRRDEYLATRPIIYGYSEAVFLLTNRPKIKSDERIRVNSSKKVQSTLISNNREVRSRNISNNNVEYLNFEKPKIKSLSVEEGVYWKIGSYENANKKRIYALIRKNKNNIEIKLDNIDNRFGSRRNGVENFKISKYHGLLDSKGGSISDISLIKDLKGSTYFIDRYGVIQSFKGDIKIIGKYSYDPVTYSPFDPLYVYALNGSFYFYSNGLVNESHGLDSYSAVARYNSANSLRRFDKPQTPKFLATNSEGMTFVVSLEKKQWVRKPFKGSDFRLARLNNNLGIMDVNSTTWIIEPKYDVIEVFKSLFFCKNHNDRGFSVYSSNGTPVIDGVIAYYRKSPFDHCSSDSRGVFVDIGFKKYTESDGRSATSYSDYYGYIKGDKCIINPDFDYLNTTPNGFLIGYKISGNRNVCFIWDKDGNQLHYSDKNYLVYNCREKLYRLLDFNVIDPKTENHMVIRKGYLLNEVLGVDLDNPSKTKK